MKKLGLAFGAGGTRGFAHLGAMKVLEENNIKVDVIVGSSMGSLLGALIAAGLTSDDISKLAKGMGRDPWLDFVIPKIGLVSTKKIYEIVKLLTKNKNIEDLAIKFATVGTDLRSGKEYVFRQGSLADAVCGSVCVPGIFEPYEYQGMLLTDGAVSDPTPCPIVRELGADVVVALDVANQDIVSNVDNIYEVIVRALSLMQCNLYNYKPVKEQCDVLVHPDFAACGVNGLTEMKYFDDYYAVGKKAMEDALPEIKKLLED